jgi:predicted metal-dependent hydrolase
MRVEVRRSARRRKTVSARQVGDVLRVSIPAWMGRAEEQKWVAEMLRRFERTRATAALDLEARSATLAARYRLPVPASVRISSRLTDVPVWVLDYVLVHELAHLLEAGHGPAFRALVARYPLAERATGFLMAKGLDGPRNAGSALGQEALEAEMRKGGETSLEEAPARGFPV